LEEIVHKAKKENEKRVLAQMLLSSRNKKRLIYTFIS